MVEKLVRDKIPLILREAHKRFKVRRVSGTEYYSFLINKLLEEVNEFMKSGSIEELADVLEVLEAIMEFKGWSYKEVKKVKEKKRKERGGFKEGLVIDF